MLRVKQYPGQAARGVERSEMITCTILPCKLSYESPELAYSHKLYTLRSGSLFFFLLFSSPHVAPAHSRTVEDVCDRHSVVRTPSSSCVFGNLPMHWSLDFLR